MTKREELLEERERLLDAQFIVEEKVGKSLASTFAASIARIDVLLLQLDRKPEIVSEDKDLAEALTWPLSKRLREAAKMEGAPWWDAAAADAEALEEALAQEKRHVEMLHAALRINLEPELMDRIEHVLGGPEGGDPELVLGFKRFRVEYNFALDACRKADEILNPLGEVLNTFGDFQLGKNINDIRWFTETMSGMLTSALYHQFVKYIETNGAQNYIEIQLVHEGKAVVITLHHPDGKSPGTLNAELMKDIEGLTETLENRPPISPQMAAAWRDASDDEVHALLIEHAEKA